MWEVGACAPDPSTTYSPASFHNRPVLFNEKPLRFSFLAVDIIPHCRTLHLKSATMTIVLDDIRRPLGVFAKQAESQCYIKSIRNLGDAWRKLSDKPLPECDKNTIFVEATFGLDIKFTPDEVEISVAGVTESTESIVSQEPSVSTEPGIELQTSIQQSTNDRSFVTESEEAKQESPVPNIVTKLQSPDVDRVPTATATRPWRYRISYDWGTEHLWRDYRDLEPEDDGITYMEVNQAGGYWGLRQVPFRHDPRVCRLGCGRLFFGLENSNGTRS